MTSLRAAVYIGVDRPLQLETLELDEPGPGEVAVRIEASGLCHSDLHVMLGEWSERPPMVLGHEGCGVVESVGEDVHQFAPGDRVVLCWYAPCGECARCRAGRPWVCLNTRANSSLMPDGGTRLRRLSGEPVRYTWQLRPSTWRRYRLVIIMRRARPSNPGTGSTPYSISAKVSPRASVSTQCE